MDTVVMTGEVNAIWTEAYSNDDGVVNNPEKDADDTGLDPSAFWVANDTPRYDKDVAVCFVDGAGTQELTVIIENAYPCYLPTVIFTVDNIGTIPVMCGRLYLKNTQNRWKYSTDKGKSWTWVEKNKVWFADSCVEYWIDWDGDCKFESRIEYHTLMMGIQIDPGESLQSEWGIHIEQDAAENTELVYTLGVEVIQWNEFEEEPIP